MNVRGRFRRKLVNWVMTAAALGCVLLALVPLLSILYSAAVLGVEGLTPGFFTQSEPIPCSSAVSAHCPAGGIGPALQGTLILVGVGALLALPLGILTGVYLSEYGRLSRAGHVVRFLADALTGVSSIVIGIFVFALFLLLAQAGWFSLEYVTSALSGAVALAVIMIPLIARTVEEALRLVPTNVREAALALGVPKWKTTLRIVLSTGRAGVLTGSLLAVARGAGETAPLIMTASGSLFGFAGFNQRVDAVPLGIYFNGLSGVSNYVALAWGASFVLVLIMLAISLAARYALHRMGGGAKVYV